MHRYIIQNEIASKAGMVKTIHNMILNRIQNFTFFALIVLVLVHELI